MTATLVETVTVAGVQSARLAYKDRPVCTTQQLAQFYGCAEKNIGDNHANNRDRFEEGKHFVFLEGDALKQFKQGIPDEIGDPLKFTARLILWTELGAARHAKMLTTDKAWDVFEEMEEVYFRQAAQDAPRIPQTMPEALRFAADAFERAEQLSLENKTQAEALALAAPKVEFVERYVQADSGSMGLRQVCKVLGAKQNEFADFLLERGLMYRTTPKGPLTPRAEHVHAGRFEAKTGTAEHGDSSHAYVQYKFTARGLEWIAGLWGQHKAKLAYRTEVAQ